MAVGIIVARVILRLDPVNHLTRIVWRAGLHSANLAMTGRGKHVSTAAVLGDHCGGRDHQPLLEHHIGNGRPYWADRLGDSGRLTLA